jgi:DNA repair exonuclease SbcCD ATPase subunit
MVRNWDSELAKIRAGLIEANLSHKLAKMAVTDAEKQLAEATQALKDRAKAVEVLQAVARTIQQKAHERIAAVVSQCLRTLFQEPYEFRIVFERKRNQTEARLVFLRNGVELDPLTAVGGGVVDVAAFALRLASIVLSRQTTCRMVVLDEPFKFVSAEYRPRLVEMLQQLAKELEVQFLIVTHLPDLEVGTVYQLD